MTDTVSFDGTLVTVPFASGEEMATIRDRYRDLLERHDSEDILVITGSPTSMSTFRDGLSDLVPGAGVPRTTSTVVHATDVLNQTDDRAILSDALRRELVHRFLEDQDWENPYFQRAAEQSSFEGDVARLMETIAWQDADCDETAELKEVAEVVDQFHGWLEEHGHIERGEMIATATDALQESEVWQAVVDFDAILAVEFEEFLPLDRDYLAALENGLDLVCVAATEGSVRRTWVEPGPVSDYVEFETEEEVSATGIESRLTATASYFTRGEVTEDPEGGEVQILATETADDQIESVADEIERLYEQTEWDYSDLAVGLKQSGEQVTETIETLEQAGIPTQSATVTGFGDDPAIRELLTLVRALASEPEERADIAAETPYLTEEHLETIADMDGLSAPLRRWATESDLKIRIADGTAPLDARSRFSNVNRAFNMAEFVEETAFIETTWEAFEGMLERAHEFAPSQTQTSATEDEGGVHVDHLQALKNGGFQAIFLLDVVDSTYPGDASLTRLFPQERVTQMPDYPGITQLDAEDVSATFSTDSTASNRPFSRYHAEHARRRLAVGAAAATERLYLCFYRHEGAALDERVHPSRFLTGAYAELPWLDEVASETITSERAAESFLLSRVDDALSDIRRARSQDVSVDLNHVEGDLVEIQRLLDASGERGDRLRDALRARIDFAEGRVRRE